MPVFPATRPNLPSAVASEDKENNRKNLPLRTFSLASVETFMLADKHKNCVPTKHKKAGGGKPPAFA
jgi:hypothetical protein